MPHDYEISQISKSFAFVVDAKVDILHKDMKKIMEKLDVILSRQHGNQVLAQFQTDSRNPVQETICYHSTV